MLVTVFLSVLVLALLLGNLFLSVTGPKSGWRALKETGEGASNGSRSGAPRRQTGNNSQLGFDEAAGRERVRMLNKRIDRLESLLLKINNAKFVAKKLNGTNLAQKLNGFEEFKQDTKLQIAALKQQLAGSKKGRGPGPQREEEEGVDERKVHRLIYHSSER